jgi:8-oxo-dGTP pyrophosphatase MutT (NUDIX family)
VTAVSENPSDELGHLQARLTTLSDEPLTPNRADAAVLIVLRLGPDGLEVLAEQRAERTGDPWSGHVGLPGGRADPADTSMRATALRELREEVGLTPEELDGTPRVFDVRRARPSGLRVAVFAARLRASQAGEDRVDPDEVASTFWLPLATLQKTEPRPRSTLFGEIQVETVDFRGHVVWGFTLRLLRDFVAWLHAADPVGPRRGAESRLSRSQAL